MCDESRPLYTENNIQNVTNANRLRINKAEQVIQRRYNTQQAVRHEVLLQLVKKFTI